MTAGPLELSDARYEWHDGYPMLRVQVDGREATLDSYPKPTLYAAGIAFLGSEFGDLVPRIDFAVPGEPGNVLALRGFSADRRLFALYSAFVEAEDIEPGPVPIPD